MNPLLESLLRQYSQEVEALTAALEAKRITPRRWRDRMAALLARYYYAAMAAGMQQTAVPPEGVALLVRGVANQYSYLNNFYTEVAAAEAFKAAWRARAQMYVQSAGASFHEGDVYRQAGRFLPLPAMPKDGTSQCLVNCLCSWVITVLDKEAGDFDATWTLGIADHCQTCVERAKQWSPLRIRGGVLLEERTKAGKPVGGVDPYVRDAHGRFAEKPGDGRVFEQTVYHGSGRTFSSFSAEQHGTNTDAGRMGVGAYFTTDKRIARSYALVSSGPSPAVYTARVRLSRPLTMAGDVRKATENAARRLGVSASPVWDGYKQTSFSFAQEFTNRARRAGYDGAIWMKNGRIYEIVAYDPTSQVTG